MLDCHKKRDDITNTSPSRDVICPVLRGGSPHLDTTDPEERSGTLQGQATISTLTFYQRKWDKQRVIDLFRVIDWMMRLPEELEQQLWQEIETIEENEKMQYVTSVEKFKIAKGRQEGRQEGLQEGLLKGEAEMLGLMLRHRFGDLSDAVINRLRHASEDQLKEWLINAISAQSVDAVFNDDTTH